MNDGETRQHKYSRTIFYKRSVEFYFVHDMTIVGLMLSFRNNRFIFAFQLLSKLNFLTNNKLALSQTEQVHAVDFAELVYK